MSTHPSMMLSAAPRLGKTGAAGDSVCAGPRRAHGWAGHWGDQASFGGTMDIRSRAESLRPIRYILNHRHRDHDLESAEPASRSIPSDAHWGKAAGVAVPGSGPIAIVGMGCRFP